MLPIAAMQSAINAKTVSQFATVAPLVLSEITDSKPVEYTESEKELMERFFNKFQTLMSSCRSDIAKYAKGFQELSHEEKLEVMSLVDLSKLDSTGTADILKTEIKTGRRLSMLNTVVAGGTVLMGLLAVLDSVDKAGQRNYDLKRPRSVKEKLLGDKK